MTFTNEWHKTSFFGQSNSVVLSRYQESTVLSYDPVGEVIYWVVLVHLELFVDDIFLESGDWWKKKKQTGVPKNVCVKSLTEEGNNEGKGKLSEENILFSGT